MAASSDIVFITNAEILVMSSARPTQPAKKLELGSTAHYPPLLSFKIDHMLMKIKLNLNSKILKDWILQSWT
jgi:hypothetical protein